jgi:hypothetical protein
MSSVVIDFVQYEMLGHASSPSPPATVFER